MNGNTIAPMAIREFIPRRLYVRHISAGLDEPPSRVRYWLDSGLLESRQGSRARHRWITPEELVLFAADQGLPVDWLAVTEVDLGEESGT